MPHSSNKHNKTMCWLVWTWRLSCGPKVATKVSALSSIQNMAAAKVSLKLLIDQKSHQVLFAEARKELVDFPVTVLALLVGPVMAAGERVLVFCFNFFRKLKVRIIKSQKISI